MAKKGYKQTEAHTRNNVLSHKKKKKNPLPPVKEEKQQAFRDHKCATYEICLRNAALFNLQLNCTDCPNKEYKDPEPTEDYLCALTEEVIACCHLLRAVFRPQAWKLEDRAREKAMKQGLGVPTGREDQPEARIQWWG